MFTNLPAVSKGVDRICKARLTARAFQHIPEMNLSEIKNQNPAVEFPPTLNPTPLASWTFFFKEKLSLRNAQ
jgi:hypothetical protein